MPTRTYIVLFLSLLATSTYAQTGQASSLALYKGVGEVIISTDSAGANFMVYPASTVVLRGYQTLIEVKTGPVTRYYAPAKLLNQKKVAYGASVSAAIEEAIRSGLPVNTLPPWVPETNPNYLTPTTTAAVSFSNVAITGNLSLTGVITMSSVAGDKLSIFGATGGNFFGWGIEAGAMQMHTDGSGSDIIFGHGWYAAFTKKFRMVNSDGSFLVNTQTNDGVNRLQVNGSAKIFGALTYQYKSGAADPTTSDIPSGYCQTWYNTTAVEVRDWCNRGGTMIKSAAMTP